MNIVFTKEELEIISHALINTETELMSLGFKLAGDSKDRLCSQATKISNLNGRIVDYMKLA